jgi:hypothetical protein
MDTAAAVGAQTRRPRYRRAPEPPPFRLTDHDVEIVRVVARHRLIRSTHIAALVGRSLDRTNDRLMRLFHAGYVDRPRAQLDYYPTSGSGPMVYALADRGIRLLRECDGADFANAEWSRKNRQAGRPFIEHQIEVVNLSVELERAVRCLPGLQLIQSEQMTAPSVLPGRVSPNTFAFRTKIREQGRTRVSSVIPDLVFGLARGGGPRRNFVAEIDRGTMPVKRSDATRTSFAAKMRTYLAAYAAKEHERKFGWASFRVLTITTNRDRILTMQTALREIHISHSPGRSLFLFATFGDLRATTPIACDWTDGAGRTVDLI